jgi:hypothetical protein
LLIQYPLAGGRGSRGEEAVRGEAGLKGFKMPKVILLSFLHIYPGQFLKDNKHNCSIIITYIAKCFALCYPESQSMDF